MFDLSGTQVKNLSVHFAGSKLRDEGTKLSKAPLKLDDDNLTALLMKYFLAPFKTGEYFHLQHESDPSLNVVHSSVARIFGDPGSFHDESANLAKHLYEQSTHPKIKGGELFVAHFKDCIIDDQVADAVGVFKSEIKETFLKVQPGKDNFSIGSDAGININKPDKGCLIFNIDQEKGYLVSIADHPGRLEESRYWREEFLHVKPREDNYHYTKNILDLCKSFVTEKLPQDFEVSKADQAGILNRSLQYFKDNETFGMGEFTKEVMPEPRVREAFKEYKKEFGNERDVPISDDFDISGPALKKQQKIFKSVIKLDKNFHVYVHGNRELIVKGFDKETGLHFYQLFFKEEN